MAGSGVLTLQGSAGNLAVLQTSGLSRGNGSASVSIDGGRIRATADNSDFFDNFGNIDIALGANGGVIDTDGHDIGIAPRFAGAGRLTKEGLGTLTLTGDNLYAGGTTITTGTLRLGAGGTSGSILGDIVDNDTLARAPDLREKVHVVRDRAAWARENAHIGKRRRKTGQTQGNSKRETAHGDLLSELIHTT